MRRNQHYHDRVNRVLDYIAEHLDGELSLTRLSDIACFSPFHFHRIFQGVTGETLNSHVRRVRLERAALLMRTSPRKRITDVALEAGFAGTAEFSRAFKNHFDRTASSWDRRSPLEKSKICKALEMRSFHTVEELQRWKAAAKNVRVRVHRFSTFRHVYNRIYEPYGNTRLLDSYHSLIAWLVERRTDMRDIVIIGMSLDDPSITPSEKCRYDLGVAFLQQPGGMLGEIIRARDVRRSLSHRCRPSPNATRVVLPSVTSRPSRSSPSTASETFLMWIVPGIICTGSGCLRVSSSRRIFLQWRCSYGFRRT